MARKGIQFDQVANAAAAIQARGAEPTISAVRVELNNEGSYSTISQHLARWRSESADKVHVAALPPDVESAAMEAITKVWNVAHRTAQREVAAARQEAADEVQALKRELDEARAEIEQLEGALKSVDEKHHADAGRADSAEKKLAEVKGELSATKALYAELLASKTTEQKKPTAATQKKA